MALDATFWVAVSFIIFFGALIYFKIPQKINELLSSMIIDIKKEIEESEKLRTEAKDLLDKAQNKLETAEVESQKIIEDAKRSSEKLIIAMNDKFHKTSEIKKNMAQNKISQMKQSAIKEIRDTSVKIAIDSVKTVIENSIDKSKLDTLFDKNLNETKDELKKINS